MAEADPGEGLRVWYKPPRGKKVPRDPMNMPGDYFPPKGDWTPRSNFLQRMVARGDGKFFDTEPGTEPGDEDAPARTMPARKPLDRETGLAEAKAKLKFNPDPAPGQTAAGSEAAKPKS